MKACCIKLIGIVLVAVSSLAVAKPPSMKLECAKIDGYKTEAFLNYLSKSSGGGGIFTVDVTFIKTKPSNKIIDNVLRVCLNAAIKIDGTKDILGSAWFRPKEGGDPYDDEKLSPHGNSNYIGYVAASKSIQVKSIISVK